MQHRFKWPAILVAAIAGMFVGFVFYGLLFQVVWQAAVGLTSIDDVTFLKYGEPVELDPVAPMLVNLAVMSAYAIFLSYLTFRAGIFTFGGGAALGALVGLVVGASHVVGNLFALEPGMLSLIDGSYHVILFAVIGAIVGGWR